MEDKKTIPMDLLKLAKKFPDKFIEKKKMGSREEDYINHAVIAQRLLSVVGAYNWDFDVITDDNKVVAVKGTLTVDVDGKTVSVAGAGTPQNTSEPIGEQIKKMESDAFKRAASKLALGLQLWAQDNYFLDVQLSKEYNIDMKEIG